MAIEIDVQKFIGMMPGIAARVLPSEASASAQNIRTHSGELDVWQGMEEIEATLVSGVIRSIYLYEDIHWFSANTVASVIRSPVAKDPYARVYYSTEDGYPQVTSNLIATGGSPKPVASYRLGVPAPDAAVTGEVNVDSGADPEYTADDETRFYVMTYVTGYGEEGPPGPASAAFELASPSTETVTLTLPVIAVNPFNITEKRIYRTVTSGAGTYYYLVGQVSLATTTFEDTIMALPADSTEVPPGVGKQLDTLDFDMPPEDMRGLVMGANGIAAGFVENEIMFSEAYLPYAFPVKYRFPTEHDIVAIVPISTGFIVGTKGYPYIFEGISPDSMASAKLDIMQACVSSRSMVDMGEYALYASPNGIVAAGSGRVELITGSILTRREWKDYSPETIHAYRYQDMYFAFYGDIDDNGSGAGGFVFDPRTGSFFQLGFYATAGFNDVENDALFLVVDGDLMQWDISSITSIPFVWKSKIFKGRPAAIGCAKVYTSTPEEVGFKLWADGELVLSLDELSSQAFRLPPVRAEEWQFELVGTAPVQRVAFASALSDFT